MSARGTSTSLPREELSAHRDVRQLSEQWRRRRRRDRLGDCRGHRERQDTGLHGRHPRHDRLHRHHQSLPTRSRSARCRSIPTRTTTWTTARRRWTCWATATRWSRWTRPAATFDAPSGYLLVVDISNPAAPFPAGAPIDLGGQPDSLKISPDEKFAAIAIENQRNEDLCVGGALDGTEADEDDCVGGRRRASACCPRRPRGSWP